MFWILLGDDAWSYFSKRIYPMNDEASTLRRECENYDLLTSFLPLNVMMLALLQDQREDSNNTEQE